jgi:DnaJ family protein C protein 17
MASMAEIDPYRVLGLEPKPDLSDAEIKKAYRKKALVLHPDKRKESEREAAQADFDQLQKAYDILLDPEARAALENLAKARSARKQRDDQQDTKRRKLREDLERRERAAEAGKNEEEEAKERLQAELARLRRDFATRKKTYDKEGTAAGAATSDPEPGAAVPEHMYRTLKVVWRKDVSDYLVSQLKEIFGVFGGASGVEDVVIRDGKKKKGSALVVFAEVDHAAKAATAQCGDPTNPLLAVRAAVPPPGWKGGGGRSGAGARPSAGAGVPPPSRPPASGLFPGGGGVGVEGTGMGAGGGSLFPGGGSGGGGSSTAFPGGGGSGGAAGAAPPSGSFTPAWAQAGAGFATGGSGGNVVNRDYESIVLDRMRRAQEKARLIAEMQAAEQADDATA